MTAQGYILNGKQTWWREREDHVAKAVLQNHPLLVENTECAIDLNTYPNAWIEEDLLLPTEDVLVFGHGGWHTHRNAAIEISKALPDYTVYAFIHGSPPSQHYPVKTDMQMYWHMAWHLSSSLAMLDEGKLICSPYYFDYPRGRRKTLIKLLKALQKDIMENHPVIKRYKNEGKKPPSEVEKHIWGQLTEAKIAATEENTRTEIIRNGKVVEKRDDLINALVEDGVIKSDGVVFAGGNPEDFVSEEEFIYSAFQESAACCLENLKPGVVLIYAIMRNTIKSLKDHGVKPVAYRHFYQELFGSPCQDCSYGPLWRE
jgi:N-dimethylarginine dimethylaminohydrolase